MFDLYKRFPDTRITDIMLAVDEATGITDAFTHLRTGSPPKDKISLMNVLLAERLNLGLSKMAEEAVMVTTDIRCTTLERERRGTHPPFAGADIACADNPCDYGEAVSATQRTSPKRWFNAPNSAIFKSTLCRNPTPQLRSGQCGCPPRLHQCWSPHTQVIAIFVTSI
ncbi:Tn3 family transposase [Phaeobacter sp. S60]|uniref:Tn3 family transposase n=1 Tax=Phaeobacter sp. S60 TaxID=1569353 RepID=UPI0005915DAE|nr:hypothetical protein OO25_19410 [Phaeobacter sp. S60]